MELIFILIQWKYGADQDKTGHEQWMKDTSSKLYAGHRNNGWWITISAMSNLKLSLKKYMKKLDAVSVRKDEPGLRKRHSKFIADEINGIKMNEILF